MTFPTDFSDGAELLPTCNETTRATHTVAFANDPMLLNYSLEIRQCEVHRYQMKNLCTYSSTGLVVVQVHQGASLDRRLLVSTALLPTNVLLRIDVEKFRVENFLVDLLLRDENYAAISLRTIEAKLFPFLPEAHSAHSPSSSS